MARECCRARHGPASKAAKRERKWDGSRWARVDRRLEQNWRVPETSPRRMSWITAAEVNPGFRPQRRQTSFCGAKRPASVGLRVVRNRRKPGRREQRCCSGVTQRHVAPARQSERGAAAGCHLSMGRAGTTQQRPPIPLPNESQGRGEAQYWGRATLGSDDHAVLQIQRIFWTCLRTRASPPAPHVAQQKDIGDKPRTKASRQWTASGPRRTSP